MMEWAVLSDIGTNRQTNEDSYLVDPEKQFYIVADGMGGQAAGASPRPAPAPPQLDLGYGTRRPGDHGGRQHEARFRGRHRGAPLRPQTGRQPIDALFQTSPAWPR